MTDPRVLVKLDVLIGLLGIIALLLALQVVLSDPVVGLFAIVVLGLAVTAGVHRYREALEDAAT